MDVIDPYIERYVELLYGLCRALCASRADADDLYQETWLRAVRSFARYGAPVRPVDHAHLRERLPQPAAAARAQPRVQPLRHHR